MSVEILRKPAVLALVGMKNTWLHEAVKRGDFPSPFRLGVRAVGWRRADVEAWLDSREKAA